MSIPKEVRKLITNAFIFKPSRVEFEDLTNEVFEMNKDNAMQLMNFVYDKPHQYMMINVEQQKLFKGFDEIIMNTDEN